MKTKDVDNKFDKGKRVAAHPAFEKLQQTSV